MFKRTLGVFVFPLFATLLAPSLFAELQVSLSPLNRETIPVGTPATWTASVTDDSEGDHWYRFAVNDEVGRRIVKDFAPESAFEWAETDREGFHSVEVTVRNLTTGETDSAEAFFEIVANATGDQPTIQPTQHPLVFLYSAPFCPAGSQMSVSFTSDRNDPQSTPAKPCDGRRSMNFLIGGLRARTTYTAHHHVVFANAASGNAEEDGPPLTFTTGPIPSTLPTHQAGTYPGTSRAESVFLGGSLFTNFVATDLDANIIWYYPKQMLFFTRPEAGGTFFGIQQNTKADTSQQVVREFDLAGTTLLETNAARVNEQLAAMGKHSINAFHHDARRLSNGNIVVLAGTERLLTEVQGPGQVDVLGDMIIVLNRDLEVVWTWDAFDYLDAHRKATMGDTCTPDSCPPLYLAANATDWLHANSISETPDGNLLLSLRHQDWLVKIDYRKGLGTGKVLWRLGKDGDFTISTGNASDWFSHQHDGEFEVDGTLTLLDNGNLRQASSPGAHSRGQVFMLDESTKMATIVMNVDLGSFAFALGSAGRLNNGNYYFDAGFRFDATGITFEFDKDGNWVSVLKSSAPEYRTFRMKDMYRP